MIVGDMMYKYEHGGDIYSRETTADGKRFVDFSANINPLGLPLGVKEAVKSALKGCVNYPDPFCRRLTKATADFLGVQPEYLFFGNGAADVLFRLALALKPKRAVLLAPTFADYEKALRSVKCAINYYELKEDEAFIPGKGLMGKITNRVDLVVVCNPNNPTGQLMDRFQLERALNKCRALGAKLLVDECFMDFVSKDKAYSMKDLLAEYPELIILKAFTKTFAMPGIRLGYCLNSDPELHTRLHQCGQDWSVSVLAQEAGIAALQEQQYLHESFLLIEEERKYLKHQLTSLGAKVYGSEANYIFFYMPEPANLVELLREQGYLIRSCANYHNLGAGYYRVAVKTRVLNRGLIKAIKEAKQHALFTGFN